MHSSNARYSACERVRLYRCVPLLACWNWAAARVSLEA